MFLLKSSSFCLCGKFSLLINWYHSAALVQRLIVLPQIKELCTSTFLPLKPFHQRSKVTAGHSSCSSLADALLIWLHKWNAKIRPQWDIYLLGLYPSITLSHITENPFKITTFILIPDVGVLFIFCSFIFCMREWIDCSEICYCYLLMCTVRWLSSSPCSLPPTRYASFHTFSLTY